MTHNFNERNAWSHQQQGLPMWGEVYRKAFPTMIAMAEIFDLSEQRAGIDRKITLANRKVLTVDEKIRAKDYDDILLEYWSNLERRVGGWISKELSCDFIAYAFLPSRRCYLLPFHHLRMAWRRYGKTWVKEYRICDALNKDYTTRSVAVPIEVLRDALRDVMLVTW